MTQYSPLFITSSDNDHVSEELTSVIDPGYDGSNELFLTEDLPVSIVHQPNVIQKYGATNKQNSESKDWSPESSLYDEKQDPMHSTLKSKLREFACVLLQILPAVILAGLGQICAGFLLKKIQVLSSFREIPHLLIMIPTLLGLKGNLEMTLVSRLTTTISLQDSHDADIRTVRIMVLGNLVLIQVQALIVGLLACLNAFVIGAIAHQKINISDSLILVSSSLITASASSAILGFVMVMIVLISPALNIDPDNIGTPIAATLGDITTLTVFGIACEGMFGLRQDGAVWFIYFLTGLFLLLIPIWIYVALRVGHSRILLKEGWIPIILSMVISSGSGVILEKIICNYSELSVYVPVINGVGGNFAALNASKLSTRVHHLSSLRQYTKYAMTSCILLLVLVVPVEAVLVSIIYALNNVHFGLNFYIMFMITALLQVSSLLVIGSALVWAFSFWGQNPDNIVIPYVTALGDLLGTGLLSLLYAKFIYRH